jgi:hypothetical protein
MIIFATPKKKKKNTVWKRDMVWQLTPRPSFTGGFCTWFCGVLLSTIRPRVYIRYWTVQVQLVQWSSVSNTSLLVAPIALFSLWEAPIIVHSCKFFFIYWSHFHYFHQCTWERFPQIDVSYYSLLWLSSWIHLVHPPLYVWSFRVFVFPPPLLLPSSFL